MRTGIIVLLSVVAFALSSGGYALAGEAHDAALNGAAGSLEVILRESPESVDSCDDSGNTPLFYAAGRGDSEIISVLLKYGADPNAMNAESKTALFYASDVSAAVALVEAGADITRRDQAGNGPLHYAARANGVELARYFIEKGQDASEKNAAGETPVHASAGPEMTRLLLESGSCQIDADARNAEGRTPIFFAQDPVTAGMLIESGADVNAADSEGRTALSCALQNSNPALADYLIDSDAELDARDAAGRTALFYAGDAELAVKMAAKGADKNIRDANGLTPLLAFLQRENLDRKSVV